MVRLVSIPSFFSYFLAEQVRTPLPFAPNNFVCASCLCFQPPRLSLGTPYTNDFPNPCVLGGRPPRLMVGPTFSVGVLPSPLSLRPRSSSYLPLFLISVFFFVFPLRPEIFHLSPKGLIIGPTPSRRPIFQTIKSEAEPPLLRVWISFRMGVFFTFEVVTPFDTLPQADGSCWTSPLPAPALGLTSPRNPGPSSAPHPHLAISYIVKQVFPFYPS